MAPHLRDIAASIIGKEQYGMEDVFKTVKTMLMGYFDPDGTSITCGNRCMMHIESGPNKNRCTIHGEGVVVPNKASCKYYMKGPAAGPDHAIMKVISPEKSGLVMGEVQCKRCKHAIDGVSRCGAAEKFLRALGSNKGFPIHPDGCCDFQYPKEKS